MPSAKIVFDTSAVNALAKGDVDIDPFWKGLTCGFDVLLTATSIDEIVSTTDERTREKLFVCCQRLLSSGICVWPPHEIASLLVSAYAGNRTHFAWQGVDIRASVYERGIINRDFDNKLCETQLNEQLKLEEEFMGFWQRLRLKLQPILEADPEKCPTTYAQALEIATSASPNLVCGIAQELYARVSGSPPTDTEIKSFLEACPPFRGICYGLVGSWYDVALAPTVYKRLPGRNDHLMAVYLPYCGRFITRDRKQEQRLRDVAAAAKFECEVLALETFCASLEIAV